MTANPRGQIFAILKRASLSRSDRLRVYGFITCREVKSTNERVSA